MLSKLIYPLVFLTAVLVGGEGMAALSVHEILRTADQARGNLEGVTWEVVLTSIKDSRVTNMTLLVKARGFNILGHLLAPPKSKDNKILMVNRTMWFYKPGLSKPVPISRRQKLFGNAAYGDIATTNYAKEYMAMLLKEEKLRGENCYVFDLRSKDKKTTYDRIKYWVSKARLLGVQAHFFTVSGKMIKSATMDYANTVTIEGEVRPFISRTTIRQKLLPNRVTTLIYGHPDFHALPNSLFNLNLFQK